MKYKMVILKEKDSKSVCVAHKKEFYTGTVARLSAEEIIEKDINNSYIGYIIEDDTGKVIFSNFKEETNERIKTEKKRNKFNRFEIMDI